MYTVLPCTLYIIIVVIIIILHIHHNTANNIHSSNNFGLNFEAMKSDQKFEVVATTVTYYF